MRLKTCGLVLFAALMTLSISVQAQDAAPGSATLDSWVGDWQMEGNLMGAPATGTLSWSWNLDGWFLYGVEVQTLQTEAGPMTQEIHHVMRPMGDGTYMTSAMNSLGEVSHGTASDTENGITFATEQGGQALQYVVVMVEGTGAISTINMIAEDGTATPIGVLTYSPVAAAAAE